MKTVTLSIRERLLCDGLINGFKGSMALSAKLLEDIKNIAIFSDEKTKINYRVLLRDGSVLTAENPASEENPAAAAAWDDASGTDKEVELSDETHQYLVGEIKKKDEAGDIVIAEAPVFISLSGKLK